MKKVFGKTLAFVLAAVVALMLINIPVYADDALIKCDSSVYMGNTFNVTVTFRSNSSSGLGAVDALLTFDETILECTTNPSGTNYSKEKGGYLISFFPQASGTESTSFTFKFKGKKEGSAGFHISAEITDFDVTSTNTKEANARVTVIDKSKLSGNADLKELKVSAGKLEPAFSSNVTNYNIVIPYSATELLVSATTVESKATISIQGSSKMQVGKNTRKIIIAAPNGTTKTYILNITRLKEGENVSQTTSTTSTASTTSGVKENPYEIVAEGKTRYVANDYSFIDVPIGFTATEVTINNIQVPAVIDPVNVKTLVYATDKDGGDGKFYIFDRESDTFSVFRYIETKSTRYVIFEYPIKVAPTGYYYTNIEIGGYTCGCFKYSDASLSDFAIVYIETANGEKGFFRYDKKDGSYQRAVEFTELMEKTVINKDNRNIFQKFMAMETKNKIIVGAAVGAALLIIALAVILIIRNINARRSAVEAELADTRNVKFLEGVDNTDHSLYLGETILPPDSDNPFGKH